MQIMDRAAGLAADMRSWRHMLHAHPETAYEEYRTAQLVASLLESWGIEVHRGIGGTGIVGVLQHGNSTRSVALRADMDALDLAELGERAHRSIIPNKMHACGHDGHSAMLLGAARCLAERRAFDGTIYFIFQPAEENWAGARAMIRDGLFDRFPADAVFGLHNMPGLEAGHFAFSPGQTSAEAHKFTIDVRGVGTHSADPGSGIDPIQVAADILHALRDIPVDLAPPGTVVPRITEIKGGLTLNVVPEAVLMRGTTRILDPNRRDAARAWMTKIVSATAERAGATAAVDFLLYYPIVVNTPKATASAVAVAREIAGEEGVTQLPKIDMSGEDFSFLAQTCPEAAYLFIGNGLSGPQVHNPRYDFNDDILAVGATYWVRLAELQLSNGAPRAASSLTTA